MEDSTHSTSQAPEPAGEEPFPSAHSQADSKPQSQSQSQSQSHSQSQSNSTSNSYSQYEELSSSASPTLSTNITTPSTSSYLTYPVSYAMSGILRRLGSDPVVPSSKLNGSESSNYSTSVRKANTNFFYKSSKKNSSTSLADGSSSGGLYSATTTPRRQPSPFEPPPLYPLNLNGYKESTQTGARLLSKSLAEEIRLLIPPQLQLVDRWALLYSLEQDGVSLGTLYKNCSDYKGRRGGYVVVVRDRGGGTFGAYLSDAPYPSAHFYGTGECFLWRASILPSVPTLALLPPPPSEDTTNLGRMTTIRQSSEMLTPQLNNSSSNTNGNRSGTSTPDRIRFKAFPYSGINDYMIFCQQDFLSVGGGDGHYGLWLNDNLEKGVSNTCPTFGNEMLSDDGSKFDVLGVEVWYVGLQE